MSYTEIITNNADEILPGFWLGNKKAALDSNWIHSNRIQCVFNCSKDIPFLPTVQRQYRVPVHDNLQKDEIRNLTLWSWEVVTKLINNYKTGQPLLVHCAAGMQRSAACTAMFLIAVKNMTADEAIEYIRSKRPIAFRPFVNFRDSIDAFYNSYQKYLLENKF
jgi:rhodanese-related sulfurtransferase